MLPSGPGDHVVRLVELVGAGPRLARRAEAHQQLAVGAELVDLVSLRPLPVPHEVGHPDVAVGVHVDAVRRDHDAAAEVRQHLPRVAVELEDRVDGVGVAVDGHAPAERAGAAALVGPDVAVERVDVDAGGRAHTRPSGRSPQFGTTVAVGFGRPSPVIVLPCAWASVALAPSTRATQANNVNIRYRDDDMALSPCEPAFGVSVFPVSAACRRTPSAEGRMIARNPGGSRVPAESRKGEVPRA